MHSSHVRAVAALATTAAMACGGVVDAGQTQVGAGGRGGRGGEGGCLAEVETVLAPLCRDDGWCWIDPYPQGADLVAVEATGPDELWFGGDHGTVLRHGPTGFALEHAPIGNRLNGLVVLGDGDVWASTMDAVFHRTADGWQQVEPDADWAYSWRVFGSPAIGLYVAGYRSAGAGIQRWNGSTWERMLDDAWLFALWGASPDDLWFSNAGWVERWVDGWAHSIDGPEAVEAISGSGPDDVWMAGSAGVWHWDGVALLAIEAPPVWYVRSFARDDVWFWGDDEVARWDGEAWQLLGAPFTPRALWPEGDGKAWIAGDGGAIARWDGTAWVRLDRRLGPFASVEVDPAGLVRAVGPGGRNVRIDPATLVATAAVPEAGAPDLSQAHAPTPNELWARAGSGDEARTVRWNGCRWSPEPSNPRLFDAAGGAVFAAGVEPGGSAQRLFRIDDGGRRAVVLEEPITAIHAVSGEEALVAVETAGGSRVLRWSGDTLQEVAVGEHPLVEVLADDGGVAAVARPGEDLHRSYVVRGSVWLEYLPASGRRAEVEAMWASAPNDVWFLGGSLNPGEELLHWNGDRLAGRHALGPNPPGHLTALGGTGEGEVWIGGSEWNVGGTVARWTGTGLVPIELPAEVEWVRAVRPFASGEAWLSANGLFHFDGIAWSGPFEEDRRWNLLWASAPTDVWAAGAAGALRHFDGHRWTAFPSGVDDDLVALSGTARDDVWAACAGGAVLHWDGSGWARVIDTGHPLTALHAVEDQVWLGAGDGTVIRLVGGVVVHEEELDLEVTGLVAFGADDVWVAGEPSGPVLATGLQHWDGVEWTQLYGGLEWNFPGPIVRWRDGLWAGVGRDWVGLRELPPGERWVGTPVRKIDEVAVDRHGDLWLLGRDRYFEASPPALLRYRPLAE